MDELIERFKQEGMKVSFSKDPGSGNIFVLPAGSNDVEGDGILVKHLSVDGDIDEDVLQLIIRGA